MRVSCFLIPVMTSKRSIPLVLVAGGLLVACQQPRSGVQFNAASSPTTKASHRANEAVMPNVTFKNFPGVPPDDDALDGDHDGIGCERAEHPKPSPSPSPSASP